MAENEKPIHSKLEMIRALRQDELERLQRIMAPFPRRDLPTAPIASYERAVVMDEVFTRLETGESLELVCLDPHMPDRTTVMKWLHDDLELSRRYDATSTTRARALFELALWEVQRATDRESMYIAEKRSNMYLRAASLLDPKRYSDKTHAVLGKQQGNAPVSITLNIGAAEERRELTVVPTIDHTDSE